MALEIVAVPALQDNYAYLIHDPPSGATAVVDPSEAPPVLQALGSRGWGLDWILNTHHHPDHTGGNLALKAKTGARVIAPRRNLEQIPGIDQPVEDGQSVRIGGAQAWVIGIPGHTLGHTAYWFESEGAVFTGDTLFLLGCGRLFEGTPAQMWASLQKLRALPPATRVYCGHEYTEKNAAFARTVDPANPALATRSEAIARIRAAGQPTVPGTLAEESATNPFLRADDPGLQRVLGMEGESATEVFAALRRRKDEFRG
jgi:hydroxyacylglutathione hydrolase